MSDAIIRQIGADWTALQGAKILEHRGERVFIAAKWMVVDQARKTLRPVILTREQIAGIVARLND